MNDSAVLANELDYYSGVMELIEEVRRQIKRDFENEAISYQTFIEKSGYLERLEILTIAQQ